MPSVSSSLTIVVGAASTCFVWVLRSTRIACFKSLYPWWVVSQLLGQSAPLESECLVPPPLLHSKKKFWPLIAFPGNLLPMDKKTVPNQLINSEVTVTPHQKIAWPIDWVTISGAHSNSVWPTPPIRQLDSWPLGANTLQRLDHARLRQPETSFLTRRYHGWIDLLDSPKP